MMLKERAVDIVKAHLDDAITTEKNFEAHLRGLLREGDHSDPQVLFREHIEQTETKRERLATRLQALGGSPSTFKSFLVQLFSFSAAPVQWAHAEEERNTQDLITAFAVKVGVEKCLIFLGGLRNLTTALSAHLIDARMRLNDTMSLISIT